MQQKLRPDQKAELVSLFSDHGWRIMHLVRKYHVHHSTVQHHVSGVPRNVQPIDYCPQEIAEESAQYSSWKRNRPRNFGSYEEYLEEEDRKKQKKRENCKHTRVAIICLECTEHLEETRTHKAKAKIEFI